MHHDEEVHAAIVILTKPVLRRIVRLSRPDVVERLDVALFKEHGLQVLERLQHLLARLVLEATFLELVQQGAPGWTACQTGVPAQLHDPERVQHAARLRAIRLMQRAQRLRLARLLLYQVLALLLGDLLVDLDDVLLAGDGEVPRLHDRAVDVLAPILSHLLLVDYAKELGHELRIDGQKLDQAIPDAEDLVGDHFDVTGD